MSRWNGVAALRCAFILLVLAGCASEPKPGSDDESMSALDWPQRENFTQRIEGTGIELEMIAVPGGLLGYQTRLVVKPFYISKIEIPWELYDLFIYPELDDANAEVQAEGGDAIARPSKPYVPPDRGFGHAGYPAISMTHHAATEFCTWLSARTGRTYRLPTGYEWRYACAGADVSRWRESAESDRLDELYGPGQGEIANAPGWLAVVDIRAWHDENSDWKTHPVGAKDPNEFGLYDMLGNVSEWVDDFDFETHQPIAMGGNWQTPPNELSCHHTLVQSSAWNASDPQIPKSKWWLPDAPFVGFRVVCEVEQEQDSPQRHGEED